MSAHLLPIKRIEDFLQDENIRIDYLLGRLGPLRIGFRGIVECFPIKTIC